MDTIRMGIVGVGNMGSAHAGSLWTGRVPGLTLAALCDKKETRRAWAREAFPGLPVYAGAEELMGSGLVDAVLIATPHYLHPELAQAAFAHGLHVLTEKPAGVSAAAVRRMNEAAAASGRVFGIMFNQRTHPLFQKARALIQSGALGVPKRFVWQITNWYRTQAYYESGGWRATWSGEGGGVLTNQAPHNLDLWQWLFGMPSRLRAFCTPGKYHHIEVEDDAVIYAEYENGATAVFITSTGECPGTNRLEASGDGGRLVIEEGRLRFWRLDIPERKFCFSAEEGFAMPPMTAEEYTAAEPESGHNDILRNFAQAVRGEAPLLAPGEEGIRQVMLTNAAYLSAWTDGWVDVPCDETAFEEQLAARAARSACKSAGPDAPPSGQYSERWKIHW